MGVERFAPPLIVGIVFIILSDLLRALDDLFRYNTFCSCIYSICAFFLYCTCDISIYNAYALSLFSSCGLFLHCTLGPLVWPLGWPLVEVVEVGGGYSESGLVG